MPPSQTDATPDPENGIAALRRFLPYLWPKDRPGLRFRVVLAMALVIGAKCITLMMPFAYKAAIDHMTPGHEAVGLAMALVVAYAAARFGGVLFDNLRNAIFERVGQEAARRLAMQVFAHLPKFLGNRNGFPHRSVRVVVGHQESVGAEVRYVGERISDEHTSRQASGTVLHRLGPPHRAAEHPRLGN